MAREKNPEGTNRKRTVEVRLKLSPGIAETFAAIAEVRGLLPATLAAVVVGEFIEKHAFNAELQRMASMDIAKRFAETIDEDKLAASLAHVNPEIFQQLAEGMAAAQDVSSAAPEAAADGRA